MKATGIIRRIDDLGRVVIPKELRRSLRIREGDPLEVFVSDEGEIMLKQYSEMKGLKNFSNEYAKAIYSIIKQNIVITDRTKVIASAGPLKNRFIDKDISEYIQREIDRRANFVEKHKKEIEIISGEKEKGTFSLTTILANSDAIGMVIILSDTEPVDSLEEKIGNVVAQFLGKQIESWQKFINNLYY